MIILNKICSKCKILKSIDEFYFRKDNNKYRNDCKICFYERNKQWKKKNRDKLNAHLRQKRKENPEHYNAIGKKYRDKNPKKRYKICTKWRKENPKKNNAIQKRSYTKRRATPEGNLNHRIGVAMQISLKGNKNGRSWESVVGYTCQELKKHLEKQFTNGMTWEKFLNGKIHIDHRIPISLFNITSTKCKGFKKCWELSNLQPLSEKENISKGNKLFQ